MIVVIIPYLVMFVPVPADRVREALTAFNADVNDFVNETLGPNRYARCLITQPDGKQKPCPKEINGKYNPCANCPNRRKLPKENKNPLSLEALEEWQQPSGNMYDTESCVILGSLLDNLMDDFTEKCPHYTEIVRLGYNGMSIKDIVRQLPVQKSQGYQIIKDCRKAVEEYLRD